MDGRNKKNSSVVWDGDNTVKLIQLYELNRVLWDTEHRGHQNRYERNLAWAAIAHDMGINFQEIKRKMNSLMAVFRCQHRKGVANPRWWASHMTFLLKTNDTTTMQIASPDTSHLYSDNSIMSLSDDLNESDCEFVDSQPNSKMFQSAFKEFRAEFEAMKMKPLEPHDVAYPTYNTNARKRSSTELSPNDNKNYNKILKWEPIDSDIKPEPSINNSALSTSCPQPQVPNESKENDDMALYIQYLECKMKKYSTRTRNAIQFHFNRILYKADMGLLDKPYSS
ncbi:uncharacterized protein LOC115633333 [Scaptodrosophila lebanonensis]|uniref:Uncharacterized protein LOC115633333 n=1 Tax=Drosophila lebanonensis TaxID=7225 RepID=A0A6J2UEP2_DROLE|nr:uncharacterized protein LOC115633333 [Scaptodrosophila lebanonensis]